MSAVKELRKECSNTVKVVASEERCQKANEVCWMTKAYSKECCCALCSHGKTCPGSDVLDGPSPKK